MTYNAINEHVLALLMRSSQICFQGQIAIHFFIVNAGYHFLKVGLANLNKTFRRFCNYIGV